MQEKIPALLKSLTVYNLSQGRVQLQEGEVCLVTKIFSRKSHYLLSQITKTETKMLTINIGTWNLCLGLTNKKDIVTSTLSRNNIKICCLQETEVPNDFPDDI